jgi:hypothetical protein
MRRSAPRFRGLEPSARELRRRCAWLVVVVMIALAPSAARAEDAGESGGGGGGGGGESGGGDDGGDFNYDDGSGSVTVVDFNRGNQDVARAAREGRTLTLTGSAGQRRGRLGAVPEYHRVVRGDTLWDLSSHYYANPWNWPRVWSFNPEITNPNWIYPGDRIRLIEPGQTVAESPRRGGFHWSRGHRPGTIFIRSRGFIDRETLETMGTIVGSREEQEMLVEHDEVYVEFPEDDYANIGEEYTIFRVDNSVTPAPGGRRDLGSLVEIFGAARVVSYDDEENIARAVITESIHPIERGFLVGPIRRRYEIIPPVQNQVDVEGRVITAVDPIENIGEGHLAFVDRGQEDGIVEGNRLFVRRQRDMWRESWGRPDDRAGYPYEIIAELRVIEVRPRTSTCMVTRSTTDIHSGDTFEMRRGY